MENIVFYIGSDFFDGENLKDEKFVLFKQKVIPLFEVARQLKAEVWYAETDIKTLTEELEVLDEYYTQSQGNFWEVLLEDFQACRAKTYCFKVHFSAENTSIEHYPIASALFLGALGKEHKILLSAHPETEIMLLGVQSNTEFQPIRLNLFDDPQKIWQFINTVLPKRKYNFSSKHGNDTCKAIPPKPNEKVSQLKCSDDDAQKLLDTAVFDLRERKWCYNFDPEQDTFIIFPDEGNIPSNQYHAFHIEKHEWKEKVPTSILKFFKKY